MRYNFFSLCTEYHSNESSRWVHSNGTVCVTGCLEQLIKPHYFWKESFFLWRLTSSATLLPKVNVCGNIIRSLLLLLIRPFFLFLVIYFFLVPSAQRRWGRLSHKRRWIPSQPQIRLWLVRLLEARHNCKGMWRQTCRIWCHGWREHDVIAGHQVF